ncbi:MAG: hypothetical protein DWQ34_16125 [Planctomycetota bacterium]|nr:MAG: hypothetical protein DWQ34_16125 [Planctomycetota bacterium]
MRSVLTLTTAIALSIGAARTTEACPFCEAPSLTLTEQLNQSDVAALVQWVESKPLDREEGFPGSTTYEVVEVVHDASNTLEKGGQVTLKRDRAAQKGDLFLLLGTNGTTIEWSSPLEVTETAFQYMKQAPTRETAPVERLGYFLQFLEWQDPLIANDAYAEFANAPYKDIALLADEIPRESVRDWILDPNTPPTRIGLYGLLLGLSGNEDDAQMMLDKILEPTQEFRLGINGVMSGYMLLTGEEGLAKIEDAKLRDEDAPFSETYAAMQSLRFMWTYAPERISKERLRQSMRILLERPELADLVVTDLARWHDWSVVDRLMDMYDEEEYSIPSIKRAIVRFFLVAEKVKPEDEEGPTPEAAEKAADYLAQLRENDPETVKQAERFFFVN